MTAYELSYHHDRVRFTSSTPLWVSYTPLFQVDDLVTTFGVYPEDGVLTDRWDE